MFTSQETEESVPNFREHKLFHSNISHQFMKEYNEYAH